MAIAQDIKTYFKQWVEKAYSKGLCTEVVKTQYINVLDALEDTGEVDYNRYDGSQLVEESQLQYIYPYPQQLSGLRVRLSAYKPSEFLVQFNSTEIIKFVDGEQHTMTTEDFKASYSDSEYICLPTYILNNNFSYYDYTPWVKFGTYVYRSDEDQYWTIWTTSLIYKKMLYNGHLINLGFFTPAGGLPTLYYIPGAYNMFLNYKFSDIATVEGNITNPPLDAFSAIDDESTVDEMPTYSILNNDNDKRTMFTLMPKAYMMQYLKYFNIETYYLTDSDLLAGINAQLVDTPPIPSDPGIPTVPGQADNPIKNSGGAGDFTSDEVSFPLNPFVGTGTGISTYLLTPKQMRFVLNKVWDPDVVTILTNFDLSPVVNALIWPCNMKTDRIVDGVAVETATAGVYIGKTNLDFIGLGEGHEVGYFINPLYIKVLDFGTLNLKSSDFYGSFLDYEPYTTINLYLPYYGIVPIATHDVIDHEVRINICLDVGTGAGKYIVLIDGVCKYSFDCQIGVEIQLTNQNFSSSLNALLRNSTGQILTGGTPAGAIAAGAIGNFADTMTSFDTSTVGASGNNNERLNSQEAFFIIERMETAVPTDYNKNYGRPSEITIQMSELKGFTTVPNVLIETTATEPEKQEIIRLLNEGVIIK